MFKFEVKNGEVVTKEGLTKNSLITMLGMFMGENMKLIHIYDERIEDDFTYNYKSDVSIVEEKMGVQFEGYKFDIIKLMTDLLLEFTEGESITEAIGILLGVSEDTYYCDKCQNEENEFKEIMSILKTLDKIIGKL